VGAQRVGPHGRGTVHLAGYDHASGMQKIGQLLCTRVIFAAAVRSAMVKSA
jgi:ssRNA-specific RNase YbeY (16S rRNA maturation enzyme)